MLQEFIKQGKNGENVFITNVRNSFKSLENEKKYDVLLELDLLEKGKKKYFDICIPKEDVIGKEELEFIKLYINAEVYNLLSSLGGCGLTIYIDNSCNYLVEVINNIEDAFDITKPKDEREFYGNCINVIDRMVNAIHGKGEKFILSIKDESEKPLNYKNAKNEITRSDMLEKITKNMDKKAICGIDIGGTDIKVALAYDGDISCFKEYDWNPKSFTYANQLVNPIVYLTKLVRAYMSFDVNNIEYSLEKAMDKEATIETIIEETDKAELFLGNKIIKLDAIGLSYPDVVVKDKVVGGETTKTRGIKFNKEVDFESEFEKITNLDITLLKLCNENGIIKNMNDGPAAAYTAAVEMMAQDPKTVKDGVFAHSLGTELGTGWVGADGSVPEMPLECYNFIIDLGDFIAKGYKSEDIRSINNVNTFLSGTLQKYTSQSGVFRLAEKFFKVERPKLYKELFDLGLVVKDGDSFIVPTEPKDMRKGFLEHVMGLVERENDEVVNEIFRQIGSYLAITWYETEYILNPQCKERTLFGRVVKKKACFDLIQEGAKSIKSDIVFKLADGDMANTPLMIKLEEDENYTVAQFAQAVGVIYFGNQGLLEKQ